MEGTWRATAPSEATHYERFKFANDSTIEITYYSDSTFSREAGTGRVYLSVGRIYSHVRSGPLGRDERRCERRVLHSADQRAQHVRLESRIAPTRGRRRRRSGYSGRERVTVYQLQRIGAPRQISAPRSRREAVADRAVVLHCRGSMRDATDPSVAPREPESANAAVPTDRRGTADAGRRRHGCLAATPVARFASVAMRSSSSRA